MGALIETVGLDGVEDVLGPAVAYIHDRLALYGEPPLWGRDTGIAAAAMALAIRAYAKATASVEHVDAWDVSRMEHEADVLRDRVAALEKENASLRRDAATELARHDQAHDHYEPRTEVEAHAGGDLEQLIAAWEHDQAQWQAHVRDLKEENRRLRDTVVKIRGHRGALTRHDQAHGQYEAATATKHTHDTP